MIFLEPLKEKVPGGRRLGGESHPVITCTGTPCGKQKHYLHLSQIFVINVTKKIKILNLELDILIFSKCFFNIHLRFFSLTPLSRVSMGL